MARILAIDYGTKRVGLAVTDPLQIIATALDTVENHKLIPYLKDYFNKEAVEKIVIGLPKRLNGDDAHITQKVLSLPEEFGKLFPEIPVILHDERFTSKLAMQSMISSGVSKKQRAQKDNLDKVSATIILQSYLEELSFTKSRNY
jgi:putative holliday junction resolvase